MLFDIQVLLKELVSFQITTSLEILWSPLKSPLNKGGKTKSGGIYSLRDEEYGECNTGHAQFVLIEHKIQFVFHITALTVDRTVSQFNHCLQGLQTSIQLLLPDTTEYNLVKIFYF